MLNVGGHAFDNQVCCKENHSKSLSIYLWSVDGIYRIYLPLWALQSSAEVDVSAQGRLGQL